MARYVIEDDEPQDEGRYVIEDDAPAPKTKPVQKLHNANQFMFGNWSFPETGRQLGLAARYGIEGLADVGGIFANPLAVTSNKLFGTNLGTLRDATTGALDAAGLPQPKNATERVVGDASRLLAGGGGMVKSAQLASKVAPVAANLAARLAANLAARPGLQAASAIGSGLSGGYVRENGGDTTDQFIASLLGGLGGAGAVAGLNAAGNATRNLVSSIRTPPTVNINIQNAIESAGYRNVPTRVVNSIAQDAARAQKIGDLSPDALRRLIDYRMVGATPLRGNLTLNPVDITNQQNIAKIGANSQSKSLQQLAMRQNQNTGKLIGSLNEMGADTADDAYIGGKRVIDALQGKVAANKAQIGAAYDKARNSGGLAAEIDPAAFTQRADDLLSQNLLNGALPADVRNHLNNIATGKTPLNVSTAEQLKTVIGNLQRASSDGGTRKALGFVRQALDEAPLMQGQGQETVNAFNAARGLNRNWMQKVENTPALKAVVDGVEPDKFVQDYIIGSGKASVADVARLKNQIKDAPQAVDAVRKQILAHLKAKATSGNPDEAMKFTSAGYRNALNAIGERKLRMFFNRQELDQLRAIERVAMYEQVQPSGSAVNNSNSGALAVAKAFDWIANNKFTQYVPFAPSAAERISNSINARSVGNLPKALTVPQPKAPMSQRIPLPLLLTPGLLEQ